MSQNLQTSTTTTNFIVAQSRSLLMLINCLHILSILACWLSAVPLAAKILILCSLSYSWHFQLKARKAGYTYLRYTSNIGWAVAYQGQTDFDNLILKPSTVTGNILTILHFDLENGSKTLMIFKDAMKANDYRKLIVLLKITG